MKSLNIAEAGHVINILPAVSISGGKNALPFSMKGADHVSIVISFGVMGANPPSSILLYQCANASGANAQLMAYKWYSQPGGTGNDIPSGYTNASAANGIYTWPVSVTNYTYLIEVDAAELGDVALPYLQVQIVDSGNTTYCSMLAVLTSLRETYQKGASMTL